LETNALFFCRADRFTDDFEGYYPKGNREWNRTYFRDKFTPDAIENLTKMLEEHALIQREYVFLNCWHLNNYESHGLWSLYSGDRGVALQSTFARLRDSFKNNPENIFIGRVSYIDWDEGWTPTGTIFEPFLHKRKYFESENELRALLYYDVDLLNYIKDGKHVVVDLDILIENVYTSPTSQKWFHELVEAVLRKYNMEKNVRTSKLAEKPV
jgi:hypothetical protein